MSILETITANIKYHEAELDKLRVARDVVARLQEVPLKALQTEGVATISSVAGNASFVATHLKHKSTRAPVIRRKDRTSRKELRNRIIDLMKDEVARSASDVTAALKIGTQTERNATWRLLTKLKVAEVLAYDGRVYLMPQSVAQLEQTSQ